MQQETKICYFCEKDLPIGRFKVDSRNGKPTRYCKWCFSKYDSMRQRIRRQRHTLLTVAAYKQYLDRTSIK